MNHNRVTGLPSHFTIGFVKVNLGVGGFGEDAGKSTSNAGRRIILNGLVNVFLT